MVRDLVETTVSGALDPVVRKRLAEITQLLQVYACLAELEVVAGENHGASDVSLPLDTPERAKEGAEGEQAKVSEREELAGELSAAMQAHGHDPGNEVPLEIQQWATTSLGGGRNLYAFLRLLALPGPRPSKKPRVIDHQPFGVDR
jgi:hypothetical protein